MTRDDWVNWRFFIDDGTDKKIEIHVLKAKLDYDCKDSERGWVASYVENLSKDAWDFELKLDDMVVSSPAVTNWCIENCRGKWNPHDPLWWEFELEEDALAFKLRWG